MGQHDLVDGKRPHEMGQQTKFKAPQLQLPKYSNAVDPFKVTDSILPNLLYLFGVFEVNSPRLFFIGFSKTVGIGTPLMENLWLVTWPLMMEMLRIL